MPFTIAAGSKQSSELFRRRIELGCFTTVSETLMESACEPSAQLYVAQHSLAYAPPQNRFTVIGHLLRLIFMHFGGKSVA